MKPRGRLFKSLCLVVSLTILLCPTSYASLAPAIAVLSAAAIQQQPPVIRGLRFDQDNPLNMEFLFDLQGQEKIDKADSDRLIRYFLAGLTIPEDKLWVNLSPLDQDRVMPDILTATDLGNDLLRQDYMLKQLNSALTYPESTSGREYWAAVRAEMINQYGSADIAVDVFTKLWIVPESAAVYEQGNVVLITAAKLKTMLDQDYKLLHKLNGDYDTNSVAARVAKSQILPLVNKDVNEGKTFVLLRQIYHSLILAQWFKDRLKESFYKAYINKEKTGEVTIADPKVKARMFKRYLESFQKGLYDYVREESDDWQTVNRRYYSGGIQPTADLQIGKKIKLATNQEVTKIAGTPLLGITAGLSFKKRGVKTNILSRIKRSLLLPITLVTALSVTDAAVSPVYLLDDITKTTAVEIVKNDYTSVSDTYGGVSFEGQTIQRQGQAEDFNLGSIEIGDFDGVGFEELGRRVVMVGDLFK